MSIRRCKIALTGASVVFLLLVVFHNLTDHVSNFWFVRHVLDMNATFPGKRVVGMFLIIGLSLIFLATRDDEVECAGSAAARP